MIKNPYKGKFMAVEGLDGSGQTTQVVLIKDFLIENGFRVITTKEPTLNSESGLRIRKVLDEKMKISPDELQRLFAQDRKEHLEKLIIPNLEKGSFVVSDRYFFSSFAYGSSEDISLDSLIELNNDFLIPDLTIILKVRPEVCISRIEKRGTAKTLFEKTSKLAKVWKTYEIMPKRFENVIIIDGERPISEVFNEIKNIIFSKLFQDKYGRDFTK
ncbi:MAG: dTMP kinase [Candidatus Pacebacteria bacterium]|nr:dTMP kinase [Candidatus Paceibacterota bacterium]